MKNYELFSTVCETFEDLFDAQNKQARLIILNRFVNCYKRDEFYDALRLFLPQLERERSSYRIGETVFTRILTKIMHLNPTGNDSRLLRDYNKGINSNKKIQDFADAAYTVVRKRMGRSSPITVKELNIKLDALAAGDVRQQEAIISDLFSKISHLEIKWLIRIILKVVNIGIGKKCILSAYHPDAIKYFQGNNSLKQLCHALYDKSKSYSEVEVSLFSAFGPMLSLRCDVKEFNKAFTVDKMFLIEEKFDGERFQLHYQDGTFKYFSRQRYDFTNEFAHHADLLKQNSSIKANSIILDGEMMIYHKSTQKFGTKAEHVDIKKVKATSNIQQCFCIFDIVYLDGKNLCNLELTERKRLLKESITPLRGLIQVSEYKMARNKQDILDALNKSIDADEEGIVFKDSHGKYHPNERVGWWKLKLEYFEGVMSDLDVVIIGGYYGIGSNKGEITGFLVGIQNESEELLSFAKISTGLSRQELRQLHAKLNPFWEDITQDNVQEKAGVFWGKEVPDKWIKPQNSTCLLVRGSELVKLYGSTSDYRTEYTLRFARILGLRLDKLWNDCMTTQDLKKLTGSRKIVEKLSKRHLELSDVELQVKPKRRKKQNLFGLPEVQIQSDILESKKFHVLSGLGQWTKIDVETAIRENGGIAQLDNSMDTYCMLVGDPHMRTRTYKGNVDIVKLDWLRRVLNQGELIPYEPLDVVYMSAPSRLKFLQDFDKFGDRYEEPATKESINKILTEKFIENDDVILNLTVAEINEFHKEIGFKDWKKLRGCVAYFDLYKIISDPLSKELATLDRMQQVDFKLHGGAISKFLNTDCHCVIASTERFDEVEEYLKAIRHSIPIFTSTQAYIRHREEVQL